jgi:hypothetical protein
VAAPSAIKSIRAGSAGDLETEDHPPGYGGIPVPLTDEIHERERGDRELRHDEQGAGQVHAHERPGAAVRRTDRRRTGHPRRASRIRDEQIDRSGRQRTQHGRKQQREVRSVRARKRRQGEGGERDTERLGGLPRAHRQATLGRREPPHDHPSARRVHRRTECTGQREHHAEPDDAWGRSRAAEERRRDAHAGDDHDPFAVPVGSRTPGDERQQDADDRRGDDEAGLEEADSLGPQRGHEHRDAVQEAAGRSLRRGSGGKDEPAPSISHAGSLTEISI